ncbi:MAG: bifunctional DedA family/phosphatase PAP2 family protein [Candidatus Pacebacteria bacterium]|nr:bifunctional DedA family/phosphatase PAP2 family protein [Candidatus Paceibacterota bacterium]
MSYIHIFSAFTDYVESIVSQGGYAFLFITTTLEGIPVFGALIPGHVAIVFSGFLVRIEVLNLWWVLGLAAVGAIIGDYIGFKIGRTYGLGFIDRVRPYFFITDAHIEKTSALLHKHTGKAMIIGRFNPVTRALMPFLVGASPAPVRKFWIFNIIGGISWTIISVFVGYMFGAGFHAAAGHIGKFAVLAIIAGFIIAWGYRFVNLRFHIFKKYELFVLILNIISLYVLAKTVQDAWAPTSAMATFDVTVNSFMYALSRTHEWLSTLALWVTTIGGATAMMVLGSITSIYLCIRRKWRSAIIMIMAVGSTAFFLGLIKEFFMRVRPDNALITLISDPSFPSAHAGLSAAFFTIVAYLAARHIHSWVYRELVIVGCALAAIAIGLTRVVLNVHWASDVIAGWALGVFLASASILLVRYVGVLVVRKG